MIRQTTTIPVVTPPADRPEPDRGWQRWAFIAAEVVLLGSIPVLALLGFRALLDSRSGEFAVEPGPEDAGWVAFVEPTRIGALVDVDNGQTAGVVLVVPNGEDVVGGSVILVSGATEIDGRSLADRTPDRAILALEEALRLSIEEPVVADNDGWVAILGDQTIELANPDPVSGDDGEVLIAAGRVTVEPSDLAAMSSRPPLQVDDPEALEFRRDILWRTLLDQADFVNDPATASGAIAAQLEAISQGAHRVEQLPLVGGAIDEQAAEALVRVAVAQPRGHVMGARLQVRIIDRSGGNDLVAAARNLGAAGFEVVQIGNAAVFDDGPTQLLSIAGGDQSELLRLADVADAATVPPRLDPEAVSTVTLLLGVHAPIATSQ
jgi:hypothetical protein